LFSDGWVDLLQGEHYDSKHTFWVNRSSAGERVGKNKLTPGYVFFYILFWPDTWRFLIGVSAACLLAPRLVYPDLGILGTGAIYIMLASIGYAFSSLPARWISDRIRKLILKDKRP
jgi:hypothetical protein